VQQVDLAALPMEQRCVLFLRREAQGPFGVAVLGTTMVGGGVPTGTLGPVTETTLAVWRSLDVSDRHGGGREGVESVSGDEFLSGMFIFGGRVVVKPRWLLSSFLLMSRLLP
jgi:hypothetical protein